MSANNIQANNSSTLAFTHISAQHWAVLIIAIIAMLAGMWLTPTKTWYDHLNRPDYEIIIPHHFGDWEDVTSQYGGAITSPDVAAYVDSVYTQVVARTYENKITHATVLLSAGYGQTQLRARQLHRPESCYSSQGFHIDQLHSTVIKVANTSIGAFRFNGAQGDRNESVTYWIRIGDKVIDGPSQELNKKRMIMGLQGYIADGLLFRVSTLGNDSDTGFAQQTQFINDLLHHVDAQAQIALIGQPLK